jgi:hypothetical protein
MKRLAVLAVVACLCGSALAGTGRADSITYTETFTASGGFFSPSGITEFANTQVTITGTGDTGGVTTDPVSGTLFNPVTATVNVPGIGTATFTDSIQVVNLSATAIAEFLDASIPNQNDIVGTAALAFVTYDLKTAITATGPGTSSSVSSVAFPTDTLGDFFLDDVPASTTFTATLGTPTATAEPASLTLLGVGAVGLLGYGWRHRRRAAA